MIAGISLPLTSCNSMCSAYVDKSTMDILYRAYLSTKEAKTGAFPFFGSFFYSCKASLGPVALSCTVFVGFF